MTIKERGRGVIAVRGFTKGEYVCEYAGELVTHAEGKKRDKVYGKDSATAHLSYLYYFEHQNKKWW